MKSTSSPSIAIALAVSLMSAGMAFAHVDSTAHAHPHVDSAAHAHPHAAVNGSSSFTGKTPFSSGTTPFSSGTTPFAAGTGATVAYDRLRRDVEASQCLERAAYKQCLQRFCPKNDALWYV